MGERERGKGKGKRERGKGKGKRDESGQREE